MILRSLLFVPAHNLRMIAKALDLGVDGIILDLEDAVPWSDKPTARIIARDSIKVLKSHQKLVIIRINSFSSQLLTADLKHCLKKELDGVMLPKTETKSDILKLDQILSQAEKELKIKQNSIQIFPLIESAKGLINTYSLASASPRIKAIAFGAGDFLRDLGLDVANLSSNQIELLYPRSKLVVDSQAAGVSALDSPFFGLLTDKEGFKQEVFLAKKLGFKGKLLTHPNQIDLTNRVFSPSLTEIKKARRIVKAFHQASAKGKGAILFEGKIIDFMNYRQARKLLELSELISNRKKEKKKNILEFFKSN